MTVEILITAQMYENYSFDDGYVDVENPSWKAKGAAHFKVTVDDFWLMYSEQEEIDERFANVIENQSNGIERFEYVGDYEILWSGIIEIDGTIE